MKRFFLKLTIVCISLIFSVICIEIFLRIEFKRYGDLTKQSYISTDYLHLRPANSQFDQTNPDTGVAHPCINNNWNSRQHRDFSESTIANSYVIGFLGDSFVENVRVPAEFSFTEPLDFILNRLNQKYKWTNQNILVMNFGVDGYDTAQSYLRYKSLPVKESLDSVYYVFCANDFRGLQLNKIVHVDESNQLSFGVKEKDGLLKRILAKTYLVYFIQDYLARLISFGKKEVGERVVISDNRLIPKVLDLGTDLENYYNTELSKEISNDHLFTKTLGVFKLILDRWRVDTNNYGQKLGIILLPRIFENGMDKYLSNSFATINLFKEFNAYFDSYKYKDIRFKNDYHWNEIGNVMSSIFIAKNIIKDKWDREISYDELFEALEIYLLAFEVNLKDIDIPVKNREFKLEVKPRSQIVETYKSLEK